MNMLEVKLEGLALDMTTNSPVVILSPAGLEKVLPIWIGHAEAWAIAMELSGVGSRRPMTHDLIKHVIEAMHGHVERVEITELREQTFFALIHLRCDGQTMTVDARPSDSIALALKCGVSIYVNEELFNLAASATMGDASEPDAPNDTPPMGPIDRETLRERLRKINPEDFGKFSL